MMASADHLAETPAPSRAELAQAIVAFTADYSIETTPHDRDGLRAYPAFLAPGTRVYVAHPPACSLNDVVTTAIALRELDFAPVPHVLARQLSNRAELDSGLERLADAGVDSALVVAGDCPRAQGPFDCTMDVLNTGLFEHYEFLRLGVAAHPEGNQSIGSHALNRALEDKARYAQSSAMEFHLLTQFGFDAQAVIRWERSLQQRRLRLPVHVGMAGPTRLRRLLRFGLRCGIGASLRLLTQRTSALANVARVAAPDQLICAYARHVRTRPGTNFVKAHFFAFGGVEQTARWVNAVVRGDFHLREDLSGFDVKI